MNNEKFEKILEDCLESSKKTLSSKAKEYASTDDRLHNFKVAARIDGHHDPLKSLKGMDLKHVVSIKDIMEMPPEQRAKLPVAFIKEKFGDHRKLYDFSRGNRYRRN